MEKQNKEKKEDGLEKATFAAGCFWGVEETFRKEKGVVSTQVGYTGGDMKNPTYEEVCTDRTGHAEAVEVTFDPKKIPYKELLHIFWNNHDPTQVNQQGPDVGKQYRSAIFYHTDAQKKAAMTSMDEVGKSSLLRERRVATQIVPATAFFRAEEYHQQYLLKRGANVCH